MKLTQMGENYKQLFKKTIIMTAFHMFKKLNREISLVVQWLRSICNSDNTGSILGRGTKISCAIQGN